MDNGQLVPDDRGPFFGVSLDKQETECRRWLDANNRPDRHKAVRPHTISPPQDGAFNILSRATVSNRWADTTNIQCNQCNNSRKFVTGGYVASYDDGWWYIVGPDCGGEEFFGRFNTALHVHNRREAERLAEGDLSALLNSLGAWQVFYANLKPAVETLDIITQGLERYYPELFRRLEEARRREGQVFVVKGVTEYNAQNKLVTRHFEERFTTLAGTKSVSRPCVAERYFRRVVGDVLGYLTGERSLIEAITEHIEKNQVAELQKRVTEGLDNLRAAHTNVVEGRKFWDASNLDWVSAWIMHPQSRFDLRRTFVSEGTEARLISVPGDDEWALRLRLEALRMYAASPPTA